MGIAFRTDSVTDVTVGEQQQVVNDFFVGQFQWTCGVLQGTVTCETGDAPAPLECALVKAVDTTTGDEFLGITDDNGFYAICVPPGTYDLMVLCCPAECCTPIACTCGCGCNGNG